MYVTRKASHYKNFPEAITESPPEGPGSGILVIQDEEFEAEARCCFGMCKDSSVYQLPLPQNRQLTLQFFTGYGQNTTRHVHYLYFIPVPGESRPRNRYYVIIARGFGRGKVYTCSKEEDMTTCCFCRCINDVQPTKFSPDNNNNIYQQIEVIASYQESCKGYFTARSVVSDGIPVSFLRYGAWTLSTTPKSKCKIGEALGITRSSKEPLVDTKHSISSPVVVGKWYCPFIFVKEEGVKVEKQLDRTMYYEMTLEQYWEDKMNYASDNNKSKTIDVDVGFKNPRALLRGEEEAKEADQVVVDGLRWFVPIEKSAGKGLGLSTVIVERMKWEQERRGWVESDRVPEQNKVDESDCSRNKFSVLVERFVLRRRNGSVALTCEFRHTNKVRFS